jgi:hypothetical protein
VHLPAANVGVVLVASEREARRNGVEIEPAVIRPLPSRS